MQFIGKVIICVLVSMAVANPEELFEDFQGATLNSDFYSDLGEGAIQSFEAFTSPGQAPPGGALSTALNAFAIYGKEEVSSETSAQTASITGDSFAAGRLNASTLAQSDDGEGAYTAGYNFLQSTTTPDSAQTVMQSEQAAAINGFGRTNVDIDSAGVSLAPSGNEASFQVSGQDFNEGEDVDSFVAASGFSFADEQGSKSNSTICAGANCG